MHIRRPQYTLAREVTVSGVGFVAGSDVRMRFRPAGANAGITFVRTDLPGRPELKASVETVAPRERRTTLGTGGAVVEMIEHVMASLAGLQIDDCTVELNAGETPGFDGSSRPFVNALLWAGIVELPAAREMFVVDRVYSISDGDVRLTISPPTTDGLFVQYTLDYGPSSAIGVQSYAGQITPGRFVTDLALTRTFILQQEADALKRQGLGARVSPRDILVFGPKGPIENRLHFANEPARHKVLDIVGDLAIFGRDIVGDVAAYKSGHKHNAALVAELTDALAVRSQSRAA